LKNFSTIEHLPNFHFIKGDICDRQHVESVLNDYHVDAIIHLAAESHVDHSFNDALAFTAINTLGTYCLLETCRKYGSIQRFVYLSTDEVYGPNDTIIFPFTEEHPLNPTNPYAATKAAAEMIIHSYRKSFQMPVPSRYG
jgi:dTDP-glucose 4,6-dehydratase